MKKLLVYLVAVLFTAGIAFTSCETSTQDIADQLDGVIDELDSTLVDIEGDSLLIDVIEEDSLVTEEVEDLVDEAIETEE